MKKSAQELNIFTRHLYEANESYWQHGKEALKISMRMIIGGVACFIHALFPFLFQSTGSNQIFSILKLFNQRGGATRQRMMKEWGDMMNQDKE